MPTSTEEQTFGVRAREHRKTAGISTIEAAYRIRDLLPESEWRSYQAIHRIETGITNEDDASPALLAALAKVYGVSLEEFSPLAAQSRKRLLRLFLDDTLGAPGKTVPGGDEDSGTPQKSRNPGNRTSSNRTGSGRARRGGRAPVQPDFPGSMGAHRATENEAA